jgi:hypothetical protein
MANKNILLAVLAGVLTMGSVIPVAEVKACSSGIVEGTE